MFSADCELGTEACVLGIALTAFNPERISETMFEACDALEGVAVEDVALVEFADNAHTFPAQPY